MPRKCGKVGILIESFGMAATRESAIGLIGSPSNEKQPPIVGRAVMLGRNLAKSECFLQFRQTHVTAIACQIELIEQMRK